jgi:hypothetical protein
MMHTVIIEYHNTSTEADRMVVRNVYGELEFARRRLAYIRRKLNSRPNIVVDTWRIEDERENVVARARGVK